MTHQKVFKTTSFFKILSDPTRYKILCILFASPDLCVGEIAEAVGISQSAASHQLAKLEDYGIVSPRRKGQMVCYVINDTGLTRNLRSIMKISS